MGMLEVVGHPGKRVLVAVALTVTAASAVAACGAQNQTGSKRNDAKTNASTIDAASVQPTDVNPCSLTNAAEVTSALGGQYSAGKLGKTTTGSPVCTFPDEQFGGFLNVIVNGRTFSSVTAWSEIAQSDEGGAGRPDQGPWRAGLSECTSNKCEVEFLAGHLDVSLLDELGNATGPYAGTNLETLARPVAAHFANAQSQVVASQPSTSTSTGSSEQAILIKPKTPLADQTFDFGTISISGITQDQTDSGTLDAVMTGDPNGQVTYINCSAEIQFVNNGQQISLLFAPNDTDSSSNNDLTGGAQSVSPGQKIPGVFRAADVQDAFANGSFSLNGFILQGQVSGGCVTQASG